MRRVRTLDDWLAYVDQADTTDGARRVLREYARGHRSGRVMSRPRKDVAAALNITERAVTKHLKRAREDGLYVVVTPGRQSRTAVYEGTFGTRAEVETSYVGTGTPAAVPAARNGGVPARDLSEVGGSHQKYRNSPLEIGPTRRSELQDSFFSVGEERESISRFSLSGERASRRATECRGCGGPLDARSLQIGFAVGFCCAVVVEVQTDESSAEASA